MVYTNSGNFKFNPATFQEAGRRFCFLLYQTRRYQQAISNKVKTDAASAFVIADLLRTGRYLASSVPEEKIESLRELMKFQHQQEEQKKATVRRINSILAVASFLAVAGFEGENFPSVVELTGYIGFFPRICQSGKSEKKPGISSQGPRFIRHSLYIAAVSCLRHNLELKCLYNKKVSQGKSPKEALIYVAKKLAHIMLALLKTGEDYRSERVFVAPTALRHFHQAALVSL